MARLVELLKGLGEVAQIAKAVRAPLLLSVIACIALFLPDQTREVYRILAQPSRAYGYVQLCFAFLALLGASFVPWVVGRRLVLRHAKRAARTGNPRLWTGALASSPVRHSRSAGRCNRACHRVV